MSEAGARSFSAERVRFADTHRHLSLFAEALSGRYLHLKTAETRRSRKHADLIAEVDVIYLPAEIADFACTEQNLGAFRISVLHQIGYLIEGTYTFQPGGESTLEQSFANWPRPALLYRVFSTVEDLRIDCAIRRRYPGARKDLERVLAHALSGRPLAHALRPVPALIEGLLQFSLGARPENLIANDSSGLLGRLIEMAAKVQEENIDVCVSAAISLDICTEIEVLMRSAPRAPLPAAEAAAEQLTNERSEAEIDPGLDDAIQGVDFRGEFQADLISKRHARGQKAPRTADRQSTKFAADDAAKAALDTPALLSRSHLAAHRSDNDGLRSFLYDEWDYIRQAYLPAWCRIFEQRLRGDQFSFIDDVRRRHSALASQVRRQFGFIKPQAWQRVFGTSDGDELDLDGVIDAVIERRRGHADDSHLYVRRDRALRDVATAFLVDMSASTDFALPDKEAAAAVVAAPAEPQESGLYLYAGRVDYPDAPSAPAPPKRRVIDVSKDALALMCDALQRLGDSHAIYGFSGDGRENVEFHVAKDFADKLSVRTWAALAAIQPRRSTRMGTAIRHALSKLARESASMKILIIISDGYPEDHDYGADRTDREYGIQDTARALREAERAGVTDFCVTIDPAGHDYLRRMCRESRYLVIDDVTALPRELSKVYRTLTQV
ncbi:MAG TPA: VWA domain-containing protein [Steroidobacteraceae bacterium]